MKKATITIKGKIVKYNLLSKSQGKQFQNYMMQFFDKGIYPEQIVYEDDDEQITYSIRKKNSEK